MANNCENRDMSNYVPKSPRQCPRSQPVLQQYHSQLHSFSNELVLDAPIVTDTKPDPYLMHNGGLPIKLNRLSVSFLVAPNHTNLVPSFEKPNSTPPTSFSTLKEDDQETSSTLIEREVLPANMHDVARILSTLKDRIVPSSTKHVRTAPTLYSTPQKDLYWSTVLGGSRLPNSISSKAASNVALFRPSVRAKEGRISKAHRCSDCGGTFKQRGALVSHIRGVHKQERPYACDYSDCAAAYKYRGDLNRHRDSVHCGFKPFPCQDCGIPFARKSVRDRHARKKHNKNKNAPNERS